MDGLLADLGLWVMVALLMALVVGFVLVRRALGDFRRRFQRGRELFAARHGLHFDGGSRRFADLPTMEGIKLFSPNPVPLLRSHFSVTCCVSREEPDLWICDLAYGHDNNSYLFVSLALVRDPRLRLPRFWTSQLEGRDLPPTLAGALEIEGQKALAKLERNGRPLYVHGDNPRQVAELLEKPEVARDLAESRYEVQGCGPLLALFSRRHLPPAELDRLLGAVNALHEKLVR